MPDENPEAITDCWRAYEAWAECLARFRREVQARDSEVWVGDNISVGTPTHPRVSAPLEVAMRGGIKATLEHVADLMRDVLGSLATSIEVAATEVSVLRETGGQAQSIDELQRRVNAQRLILQTLEQEYRDAGGQPGPKVLMAWLETMREHVSPGDPRIRVEVKVVRVV